MADDNINAQEQGQESQVQEQPNETSNDDNAFDEGFGISEREEEAAQKETPQSDLPTDEGRETPSSPAQQQPDNQASPQQSPFSEQQPQQFADQQYQQIQSQYFNNQQSQYQQQQYQQQFAQAPQQVQQPQARPKQSQVKFVKIEDNIKDELEELKKLSPRAAYLASTDTPIGASLRKNLEEYGSTIANLAAENFLLKQEVSQRFETAKVEKARDDYRQQFAHFDSVMMQRAPKYRTLQYEAQRDPAKAQELYGYQQELQKWINSKPLQEGRRLEEIAMHGRDPNDVCDLLDQFERERGSQRTTRTRVDPSGAFAVPSRGVSMPQTGLGDKDSFEDGWNISENESRRR